MCIIFDIIMFKLQILCSVHGWTTLFTVNLSAETEVINAKHIHCLLNSMLFLSDFQTLVYKIPHVTLHNLRSHALQTIWALVLENCTCSKYTTQWHILSVTKFYASSYLRSHACIWVVLSWKESCNFHGK